jgi:SAM-dependent methyltransferase
MSSTALAPDADVGLVDPDVDCPSCGFRGLAIFHEHGDVPVHSCRLVPTLEQAQSFARGTLRLGFCAQCGFISNTAYDPSLQDYSLSYEETQGFSPRFREFARELAERWIERYDLRGKDVLEIGCGKGDFLALMCEVGGNRGVGIDPSVVEERIESEAAERMTFIKDYYSEAYWALVGDAVVCRHTLEHIHPTGEFVRLVRESLGERMDTIVLFELPDVRRVLHEVAFWDLYYEHCSYFSPGSLARLFRRAGFDVLDLSLAYDDQYILVECRPSNGRVSDRLRLEDDPSELAHDVQRFRERYAATAARWRKGLGRVREAGRRAVIWGSGSKGVSFLTTLGIEAEVEYAVDINPYKHGMYMAGTGQRIVPPEFLREYRPDLVIAMNPVYLAEIGAALQSLGVEAELVAV